MNFNFLKDNKGVTLVTMVMVIIVITIIASISIIGGTEIIKNARESKAKENLTAVKAFVNSIYVKQNTSGVFTPANSNYYGTPAFGIVSGDADILNGWYLIDEDDLKEMGIEYVDENYLVNYKANRVVVLNEYLATGKLDAGKTLASEKSNSVTALAKNGKLKVGDYINYKPSAVATYTTNPDNTGKDSQTFTADKDANWRILSTDPITGEVIITTEEVVNIGFELRGIKAYMNGKIELNNICKSLYSNNGMGLVARSMTVEDVNNACGMTDPSKLEPKYDGRYGYAYYNEGYAYYPVDVDGTINYNGKEYIKMLQESETARFYAFDGGGVEAIDENGFKYRYATEDNPVYVSRTSYGYDVSTYDTDVANILGNSFGWLASTCVSPKYIEFVTKLDKVLLCYSDNNQNPLKLLNNKIEVALRLIPYYSATFDMFATNSNYVLNCELSHADNGSMSYLNTGIRPVVLLSSSSEIDVNDTLRDGSSPEKAWSLIK